MFASGEMSSPSRISPSEPEFIDQREDLPALTGLRFLAAMTVLVAHSREYLLPVELASWKHWLGSLAGFGMTLFFVLSGFVIHYNYGARLRAHGFRGFCGFLWLRFARLYPLFFLALACSLFFSADLYNALKPNGTVRPLEQSTNALPYFLLMTQSWVYRAFDSSTLIFQLGLVPSVTWSVSTEWFFYFFYPFAAIVLATINKVRSAIAAAMLLGIVWTALPITLFGNLAAIDSWALGRFGPLSSWAGNAPQSFVNWLLYFSPYLRIGEFLLGCLTAQIYISISRQPGTASERKFGIALLTLALASIPMLTYFMHDPARNIGLLRGVVSNFAFAPTTAILIFCCVRHQSLVSRMLSSRPMLIGGAASYSIYLVHLAVLNAAQGIVVNGPLSPGLAGSLYLIIRYLLVDFFIVLLSLGLYASFESPMRKWLRSLHASSDGKRPDLRLLGVLALPFGLASLAFFCQDRIAARESQKNGISILAATYGSNCGGRPNNAFEHVRTACQGAVECRYIVDVFALGDPAPGCAKNYSATYRCPSEKKTRTLLLPPEAGFGSLAWIRCSAGRGGDNNSP